MVKPWVVLLGAESSIIKAAQEEGFSVLLIQQKKNLGISAIELADETLVLQPHLDRKPSIMMRKLMDEGYGTDAVTRGRCPIC